MLFSFQIISSYQQVDNCVFNDKWIVKPNPTSPSKCKLSIMERHRWRHKLISPSQWLMSMTSHPYFVRSLSNQFWRYVMTFFCSFYNTRAQWNLFKADTIGCKNVCPSYRDVCFMRFYRFWFRLHQSVPLWTMSI